MILKKKNIPVIVVLDSPKAKVLCIAHFSHFVIKKTYQFHRKKSFWYAMHTESQKFS